MQIGAASVKNSVEFPHKIKNGTALWPSNPTAGNTCEETQNTDSKEHMLLYVHCSVIHNSPDLEAAQGPVSR